MRPAPQFTLQQLLDRAIAIDDGRGTREEPAGVGGGPVRRIERLVQETEIDGELAAMMSRMCDASDQHPGTRAPDIEKVRFPPRTTAVGRLSGARGDGRRLRRNATGS